LRDYSLLIYLIFGSIILKGMIVISPLGLDKKGIRV